MAGKYKVFWEHKSPIKDSKKLTLTWVTDTYISSTYHVPPTEETKIRKTARWGRHKEAQMSNCNMTEKSTSKGGRARMFGELEHPA